MMSRRILLLLGLWGLCSAPVGATVLADLSLTDLAQRADLIVIGTVTAQDYVVDEKRRAVLTLSTISVERTLMGKPLEHFTLTQLGGKAGSVVTRIDGDASFAVDDRVLLFTFEHEDEQRYLVGLALGAWRVDGTLDDLSFSQRILSPLTSKDGKLKPAPGLRNATLNEVKAAIEHVASSGNAATSERLKP